MLEEGYAAVSSRRVAERAGVAAPLVHYHCGSLDELFLAIYRRRTDANQQRLAAELASTDQPLWAIWEYSTDPDGTALTQEFMALANRRKSIRAEIMETAERLRAIQLAVVERVLSRYGIDTDLMSPAAFLVFMAAVPRVIVIERGLGMSTGHADATNLVERLLTRYEGPRRTQ